MKIDEASSTNKNNRMSRLKERAIRQTKSFLAMFIYLWAMFALFELHKSIVLAEHDINYQAYGVAFINAFILAKVMFIAEDFNVARELEDKPLIYSVLYKAIIFAIIFILFHISEHLVIGFWKGETIAESFPDIGGGNLEGIMSAAVIVSAALIPFFAFREIARVIGRDELHALILTRRQKAGPTASGQSLDH